MLLQSNLLHTPLQWYCKSIVTFHANSALGIHNTRLINHQSTQLERTINNGQHFSIDKFSSNKWWGGIMVCPRLKYSQIGKLHTLLITHGITVEGISATWARAHWQIRGSNITYQKSKGWENNQSTDRYITYHVHAQVLWKW